jgi:GAF domain-containing protein
MADHGSAPPPDRTGAPHGLFGGAGRVGRLGPVIAELAAAADLDALIEIILTHCTAAVGARGASLSVLDSATETLTLVAVEGGHSQARQRWATYPLSARTPASDALRERRTVLTSGRAATEARYPDLVGQVTVDGCLICLPLIAGNDPVGVISLSVATEWTPDSDEDEFLSIFADTCAQALVRIQARAEASHASARLSFLAAASAELSRSLDYRVTLATVAHLAVPTVADWCAVQMLDDGRLRTLAVAHVDPAKVALAQRLQDQYPTDSKARTGAPNVIRTGVSELYPHITDEMLVAGTRDAEHLRLSRALELRSALVVPLIARGNTLGAITLVSSESGHVYQPADVAFAEDLARRAAVAIDNAHLYSETRQAALRLQRAVLPESLAIPGWDVAAQYSPSGRTDIGGDFYDALPLPDGRLIVVMGDVMGRGVAAAAAMAQMRAAVQAYIATDPDPVLVLANLDHMFAVFHTAGLVSMVYAVIEPTGLGISLVNAGHLPPLLIRPDATTEFLPTALSPPIGAPVDERQATTHAMAADSVLLLYTDGLVERRDEGLDRGLARLAEHARNLAGGPLEPGLAELVDRVRDERRDDDVTALAIRKIVT